MASRTLMTLPRSVRKGWMAFHPGIVINSPRYPQQLNSITRIQPLFGMSSKADKQPDKDQTKTEGSEGDSTAAADGATSMSDVEKQLREENANLLEKVKDIDDKFKRALADGENTRFRMRKQVDEAKVYGIQNFCKDLLDVADVLEKAVESVPQEELDKSVVLKNLFTGVDMTNKQLQGVFRRHGLVQINPVGIKFNPNEHHALFEAEDPGKEPGTVSVVTKIGYKLQDRTIRPAMVGVVKASSSKSSS